MWRGVPYIERELGHIVRVRYIAEVLCFIRIGAARATIALVPNYDQAWIDMMCDKGGDNPSLNNMRDFVRLLSAAGTKDALRPERNYVSSRSFPLNCVSIFSPTSVSRGVWSIFVGFAQGLSYYILVFYRMSLFPPRILSSLCGQHISSPTAYRKLCTAPGQPTGHRALCKDSENSKYFESY